MEIFEGARYEGLMEIIHFVSNSRLLSRMLNTPIGENSENLAVINKNDDIIC